MNRKKSEKAARYSFTYRKCNLIYIINQIIWQNISSNKFTENQKDETPSPNSAPQWILDSTAVHLDFHCSETENGLQQTILARLVQCLLERIFTYLAIEELNGGDGRIERHSRLDTLYLI